MMDVVVVDVDVVIMITLAYASTAPPHVLGLAGGAACCVCSAPRCHHARSCAANLHVLVRLGFSEEFDSVKTHRGSKGVAIRS